jgi:hypothetical protein
MYGMGLVIQCRESDLTCGLKGQHLKFNLGFARIAEVQNGKLITVRLHHEGMSDSIGYCLKQSLGNYLYNILICLPEN